MDFNQYQADALKTDKKDEDLSYYFLQLACECGEVLNPYIKHRYHGLVGDKEKIKLELGDVLWFIAAIADKFDLTLQDVAEANIEKLRIRHQNGFSPNYKTEED